MTPARARQIAEELIEFTLESPHATGYHHQHPRYDRVAVFEALP